MGKFSIYLFIFLALSMANCQTTNDNSAKLKTKGFRDFLIENNLEIDPNKPNNFESLQTGNKYSNHYFNFSTVLPEEFKVDRGNFKFTVIRSYNEYSGVTISVGVTPISPLLTSEQAVNIHNEFQNNPLDHMNKTTGGDFRNHIYKILKSNSTLEITDLKVGEKKIRSINYVYTDSDYFETYEGEKVEMKKIDFMTILWGNTFSFSYNTPKNLFDENLILKVLNNTNYIKP